MLGSTALFAQHVADAPHGLKQIGLAGRVERLPQVSHVDLDRVGLTLEIVAPDLLQQRAVREHLAGMLHQALQQVEFPRGELEFPVPPPGPPAPRIAPQVGDAQGRGGRGACRRSTARTRATSSSSTNGLVR